jgi:hypothetical protein
MYPAEHLTDSLALLWCIPLILSEQVTMSDERQASALEILELLPERVTARASLSCPRCACLLGCNGYPSLLALIAVRQRCACEYARGADIFFSRKVLSVDLSVIHHSS